MRVSLLMPTYERPDALAAVLRSIERQSLPPFEVIVGDDGSGPETASVITAAKARGMPIRHIWKEHAGFQAGRMRNACLAVSGGEYVIMIDDDMLLHRDFVADHVWAARPGFFVQGSRVLLDEKASRAAMDDAVGAWPSFFARGVGNRKNLLRNRVLSGLLGGGDVRLKGTRTCNFALWRADFVKVNGFNEDFVGWGREDSEFVARLYNSGLRRRILRFAALACHLHHPPRSRERVEQNDDMLRRSLERKAVRCDNGLNLHESR